MKWTNGAATTNIKEVFSIKLSQQEAPKHRRDKEIKQNTEYVPKNTLQKYEIPCFADEIKTANSHDDSCNYVEADCHSFLLPAY